MSDKNLLKLEGVRAKGYGIVGKAVLLDTELSIVSKAIYCYLASYTGAGSTIFPSRDKILHDLNLSKNGYYRHYNALIEHGYIKIEKMRGYKNRNIYILVENPAKIKTDLPVGTNKNESKLKMAGIYIHGYGFIPKMIMTDTRLSIKAKGLIAYFYVLASCGNICFPNRRNIQFHLGIGQRAYYNALHQLIELDYISMTQRKDKNGKFSVNDYMLNNMPDPCSKNSILSCEQNESLPNEPCMQNEDNLKKTINKPFSPCVQNEDNTEKPCVQNEDNIAQPCMHLRDMQNEDNINNTYVNNKKYISTSYLSSIGVRPEMVGKDKDVPYWGWEKDIPYWETELEREKTAKAIYILAETDEVLSDLSGSKRFKNIYHFIVTNLISLAVTKEQKIKNETVTASKVIWQLHQCLSEDFSGYNLKDFLYHLTENYIRADTIYAIKYPQKYIKTFLWNALISYPLE